uniref:Uncharacterized protein n=1 Tax=Rhabditophanes sp. KR3021 TaxID=114890 RepID=A0AC35U091_9BILA
MSQGSSSNNTPQRRGAASNLTFQDDHVRSASIGELSDIFASETTDRKPLADKETHNHDSDKKSSDLKELDDALAEEKKLDWQLETFEDILNKR